jgi:hypothetical protein
VQLLHLLLLPLALPFGHFLFRPDLPHSAGAAVRSLPHAGPRLISTVILVGDETTAAVIAIAGTANTATANARPVMLDLIF